MTDFTRPATWEDLMVIARALDASGARIEMDPGEGVTMRVLSLEGLLLTKEGRRDKDKADRAVLLRALGRAH